jgi:DNA polymerase-4
MLESPMSDAATPARRVIAHMDCDSFYASVELLRRPELAGLPVIVAGTGPRAVVTTASYEARRFGVGSAMPASRARRLCPQAVFIKPDFTAYREMSKAVWRVVGEVLDRDMQHVSLDEAYVDLTDLPKPVGRMREVVERVRTEVGITVSVGIGPSRLVAKTASDWRKPACFAILSREQACEAFQGSPVRLLQGIGPRTEERLLALGIATVAHLQAAAEPALIERFGDRMGRWLKARAFFHDDSPVETSRILKSRSSETTFDQDVTDLAELEAVVRRLASEVCLGLQGKGKRGRTIGIKLRYADWANITRARTIGELTNDTAVVTEVALALLREHAPDRPVRLLGVRVASFEEPGPSVRRPSAPLAQLSLPV